MGGEPLAGASTCSGVEYRFSRCISFCGVGIIERDLEAQDEVTTIGPEILVAGRAIDAKPDRIAHCSLLPQTQYLRVDD